MKPNQLIPEISHDDAISWELDGGNYSIIDEAILYKGRLYENEAALNRMILRSRVKTTAKILASTLVPVLLIMVVRKTQIVQLWG